MQLLENRIKNIDSFISSTQIKLNEMRFDFKNVKSHEDVLTFQNDVLEYIKTLKSDFLKVLKGE